ncbi:MAG: hypothetical protein V5A47_09240, partial [Bacteroidales bacterium]
WADHKSYLVKLFNFENETYPQVMRNLFAAKAVVRIIQVGRLYWLVILKTSYYVWQIYRGTEG